MKFRVLTAALIVGSLGLVSCEQAQESDDIAQAQNCLDNVPASNPAAAEACYHYVSKYSSQQANILKCSILMTAGGLIEDKLVKGYEALKDSTIPEANRPAAYMAVLSLDIPNASGGYDKAVAADPFCQATGVPGLKFISGIVLAGSAIAKTLANIPGGVEINTIIDNPTAINNAINTLLDSNPGGCTSATPDASCDENLAALGTAVANLSVSYCANEKADADVCDEINEAVAAAGNNATNIGQALLCYLDNKTFNSTTGLCN